MFTPAGYPTFTVNLTKPEMPMLSVHLPVSAAGLVAAGDTHQPAGSETLDAVLPLLLPSGI